MLLLFKKGKHQAKHKPDTLTCIRDDGSITWTHIHSGFVQHDFAHYVVETTLSFNNAFFGLVAKGHDIPDFSRPKSERPFEISQEAIAVEPIVALLQAELWESFPAPLLEKDIAYLPANVTEAQIESMRSQLRELLRRWDNLESGNQWNWNLHSGNFNLQNFL